MEIREADSKKRNRLRSLARFAIAAGLLAAVGVAVDLRNTFSTLGEVDGLLFAALCATAVAGRILMAYKWNLLLRAQGVAISVWEAVRLYYVGFLLGSVTPGDLGGDAYRVVALSRVARPSALASTVVMERLMGFAVVCTAGALSLPFAFDAIGVEPAFVFGWVLALATAFVIGFAASLHPRVASWTGRQIDRLGAGALQRTLRGFHGAYHRYRLRPATLGAFALLSGLEILLSIGVCFFAARALAIEIGFATMLSTLPLAFVLLRIPISFQGLGVQEALFAYGFSAVGFDASAGLATSLLMRIAGVFAGFGPGALLMWWKPLVVEAAPAEPGATPMGGVATHETGRAPLR